MNEGRPSFHAQPGKPHLPIGSPGGFCNSTGRMKARYMGMLAAIGLALTVVVYFRAAVAVREEGGRCLYTFSPLMNGFDAYREFQREWRPRILSTYLGSVMLKHTDARALRRFESGELDQKSYLEKAAVEPVAAWQALWFAATLACWCCAFRKHALTGMLGLFAGLTFAFITPHPNFRLYAWDAPALFFFTLITIAAAKRNPWLLGVVVLVGTGFKETAMVGSVCFLFFPYRPRVKWAAFLGLAAACVALKSGIDAATGNSVFATMTVAEESHVRFWANLRVLFFRNPWRVDGVAVGLNTPWLVNAGTLLAFLLLPSGRDVWMWRLVAALLVGGLLMFGEINETRIFLELLPFCLLAICEFSDRVRNEAQSA